MSLLRSIFKYRPALLLLSVLSGCRKNPYPNDSVNNQLVTTPTQVIAAVDAARKAGRSSALLLIKRGNAPEAFVGIDITGK